MYLKYLIVVYHTFCYYSLVNSRFYFNKIAIALVGFLTKGGGSETGSGGGNAGASAGGAAVAGPVTTAGVGAAEPAVPPLPRDRLLMLLLKLFGHG